MTCWDKQEGMTPINIYFNGVLYLGIPKRVIPFLIPHLGAEGVRTERDEAILGETAIWGFHFVECAGAPQMGIPQKECELGGGFPDVEIKPNAPLNLLQSWEPNKFPVDQ